MKFHLTPKCPKLKATFECGGGGPSEFIKRMPTQVSSTLDNREPCSYKFNDEEGGVQLRLDGALRKNQLIQMAREIINQPKIGKRRESLTTGHVTERDHHSNSSYTEEEEVIPTQTSVSQLPIQTIPVREESDLF